MKNIKLLHKSLPDVIKIRAVRNIAFVLALILAATGVLGAVSSQTADARVTQAQIDKLRDERRELQEQRREVQARIEAIEFERLSEMAQKQVLDDRIVLTGYEIENITAIIEDYVLLIEEKELEVIDAIENEEAQLILYRERVRKMEENGVMSYLEIIFDSSSFSDLLARIDFIGDIMRADVGKYNNLIDARNATIAAREALEQAKAEMEEEKVLLEIAQDELYQQLEEANAIIARLESDIEEEGKLRRELSAEEDRVQREINAKVEELRRQEAAARAAARAAQAARSAQSSQSTSSVIGTGRFVWPVPSSRTITSEFGNREHPVFGGIRYHNGLDIGARHGANIVAADSGTVLTSAFNSSYGHYVVISHGNGVTTLYAHMSSRRVSANATVTQGQVIGLIGSTGVSTGPHLHFEVSVNGSRVNPMNYLR